MHTLKVSKIRYIESPKIKIAWRFFWSIAIGAVIKLAAPSLFLRPKWELDDKEYPINATRKFNKFGSTCVSWTWAACLERFLIDRLKEV